jgi:hypothetical protein
MGFLPQLLLDKKSRIFQEQNNFFKCFSLRNIKYVSDIADLLDMILWGMVGERDSDRRV